MIKVAVGKVILITLFLILSGIVLFSSVPEHVEGFKGDITGNTTWNTDTDVTGNVTIKSGGRLTIEQGVNVEFKGKYYIFIEGGGTLKVNGESGNEVNFFNVTKGGWEGIQLNSSTASANINYAIIYNTFYKAIGAESGGILVINNSVIYHSFAGIMGDYFDPLIDNCVFHNTSQPIAFQYNVNGSITNSVFINNKGGVIWTNSGGKQIFDNNLVKNCGYGGASAELGVQLMNTNIHFTNNTILNNSGHGAYIRSFGSPTHNIIFNNTFVKNGRIAGGAGIYIDAYSNKDTSVIYDNDIYLNAFGIAMNTSKTNGGDASTTIRDNDIYDNLLAGVVIANESTPNFHYNSISNNKWGILVYDAAPWIVNCTISSSSEYDWYVMNDATPTSLNTTFDHSKLKVVITAGDQYLDVKWFMNVRAREEKPPFSAAANVEIRVYYWNDTVTLRYRTFTDTQGMARYLPVLEKRMRDSLVTYYAPYNITADDLNQPRVYVKTELTNISITGWRPYVDIKMPRNYAPGSVMDIKPTRYFDYNPLHPIETHDTKPRITWSQSNDLNGDPITYYYKVGKTPPNYDDEVPLTATKNTYFDIINPLKYGDTYRVYLRAGDNRYANSTWNHVNISIVNHQAGMPEIATNPPAGQVVTDKDIDVIMVTPSWNHPKEISDYGETTRYKVYVDINEARKDKYTKLFVPENAVDFSINQSEFIKGDKIVITVIPYDGHGNNWNNSGSSGEYKHDHPKNGTPAVITLYVNNSAPAVNTSITFPIINMYEDTPYVLPYKFKQIFKDADNDNMEFQYIENANFYVDFNMLTDEITIIPKLNYFTPGSIPDELTIEANDSAGGVTDLTLQIKVIEVNDAPQINVEMEPYAVQDKKFFINITVTDPADPHDNTLTVSTNYTLLPFASKITYTTVSDSEVKLFFTPNNDDIGKFYLNIEGYDTKDTNVQTLEIEVKNVNDQPNVPIIIKPEVIGDKVDKIYFTTNEIEFEALITDPDEKWGDILEITWTSDVPGIATVKNKEKFSMKLNIGGNHKITVMVKDSGNLINSAYFYIFIIDERHEDMPYTELIYPPNQMSYPITSVQDTITLVWEPMEHIYSDLFLYDIYFDTDPVVKKKQYNKFNKTEYTVNVEAGQTYYWYVVPWLGEVEGDCYSSTWAFNVVYEPDNETQLNAKLLSPIDGDTVNSTTVNLIWSSDDENSKWYSYKIYMDTNPDPTTLIKDSYTETGFTVTNLEDNTTYYWKVIPVFGVREGICINGPFKFTTDFGFVARPEIKIEPDIFVYKMKTDGVLTLEYTITNTGNTRETLTITLAPDSMISKALEKDFEEFVITLEPGESVKIEFTINLRDADVGSGEYDIKMRIRSSDDDISERINLEFDVEHDEDKEKEELGTALKIMIIAIIIVVGIIIGVFLIAFLRIRPKKKQYYDDYKVDEESTEDSVEGTDEKAKDDEWKNYYSK
ncbi:MAG: right-handed parallel beta-helix repeat-containing protein [Thermoplasmata archaeon]|nr:MAG: right-handed parallel beta-helix repeat-containing protein [Thermoplasmata archaeon]